MIIRNVFMRQKQYLHNGYKLIGVAITADQFSQRRVCVTFLSIPLFLATYVSLYFA